MHFPLLFIAAAATALFHRGMSFPHREDATLASPAPDYGFNFPSGFKFASGVKFPSGFNIPSGVVVGGSIVGLAGLGGLHLNQRALQRTTATLQRQLHDLHTDLHDVRKQFSLGVDQLHARIHYQTHVDPLNAQEVLATSYRLGYLLRLFHPDVGTRMKQFFVETNAIDPEGWVKVSSWVKAASRCDEGQNVPGLRLTEVVGKRVRFPVPSWLATPTRPAPSPFHLARLPAQLLHAAEAEFKHVLSPGWAAATRRTAVGVEKEVLAAGRAA
ncbi:MAG: hypothetical protein M1826_004655 [Phylliscum demangeonii]|nr:MAG: hypothetical protein M1826_004655 [Phylliscum demangeonii]